MFRQPLKRGIVYGVIAVLVALYGGDTVTSILQIFAMHAPAM